MENTTNKNTLADFLSSSSTATSIPSLESSANGEESIFSSWKTWFLVILVLAFIGFNIFTYLAKGTQSISDVFAQFLQSIANFFGYGTIEVAKQTTNATATGTAVVAGSVESGATTVKNATTPSPSPSQVAGVNPSAQTQPAHEQEQYNIANTTLNKALNNASANTDKAHYSADDSYSSIQQTKSSNKSGWCFIGEDRGFRSCISVGEADTCMTGDIFPSQEICVNPNLRQ